MHGRPGEHVQVIDGQRGLVRAEAGAAALAVTGLQGGQHLAQGSPAESGLGSPVGHGAMGQHVRPFLMPEHSEMALLRGASLRMRPPGWAIPPQHRLPVGGAACQLVPDLFIQTALPRHARVNEVTNLGGRHV